MIFFRTQLLDRSASIILYKHSYAESVIGKKLEVKDSLDIAQAIADLDLVQSRIDIGTLNFEWSKERGQYKDVVEFVRDKLKDGIGKEPPFSKPRDIVLFGFGRIGRLVLRELIIQGNGTQLRVRAVVTRRNTPEDIRKRASLIRHDSIHGPFRGNVLEDVDNKSIFVNGHVVKMLAGSEPEDIG